MGSPRCACGYETKAGFRAVKKPARPEDQPINVEVESRSGDSDTANWRSQLDKKFESSRETVEEIGDLQNRVDQLFTRRQPSAPSTSQVWSTQRSDRADPDRGNAAKESASRPGDVVVASEVPLPSSSRNQSSTRPSALPPVVRLNRRP